MNRRPNILSEKADPLFHKMLVNATNQEWKDLRATVSPTFSTGKIRRMNDVFTSSSDKLSKFLYEKAQAASELNMSDMFIRYTMDVIASAAFGLDSQVFKDSESEFSIMAKKFQNQFKGTNTWKLVFAMFCPKIFQILKISLVDQEATNFFANVVKKTIKHREDTGEKRDDFLQLLIESRNIDLKTDDGTGEKLESYEKDAQLHKATKISLTEDLILAQSLLFFIAGFDTTETLLLLAAYELALNPDVQEKLYQEVNDAAESNDGKLDYEVIMNCEYLDQVISE